MPDVSHDGADSSRQRHCDRYTFAEYLCTTLFEAPDGNLVPPPAVKLCVRFPIARLLSSLKEACQSEEVAATGLSGRYQRWNQQDVHPTYSNPEELIRYHGFGVFFMVFIFSL